MNCKLISRIITRFCATVTLVAVFAALAVAQTTAKTTTQTGSTTTTQELQGTVLAVDGNNLVVQMSSGEIRHIVAREDQRAMIDGKPVAARDLKVGTKLKATVTTTTTSLTDRTVASLTGKVWYVAAPHVILTLPNGENRQYKAEKDVKFIVDGRPATVFDLRKGMNVSAQKIVDEPRIVISSDRVVTGEAPPPVKAEVAAAPAPRPAPTPAAPAPAPARAPEPAAPAAPPAQLPRTGSPLPLIGLAGAVLTALSLTSLALRRRK